ncbi:MAG: hypothetical protein KAI80_06075, partial [Hyphomicrobiaceae bacterium]|nr:hypothetical protein [Hyphomicrobiaceae bacterium]
MHREFRLCRICFRRQERQVPG